MNIKILSLAVPLIFLTACTQLMPVLPLGNSPTHSVTLPSNDIVMAMGQSNMAGKTPGFNPAESFTKATGIKTLNCAVGGTYIGQWVTDGPEDSLCLAALGNQRVIGVLWYQGEADAFLGSTTWDQSFLAVVNGWRRRWGNVPIVYAQLATHDPVTYPGPTWDLIKTQQASLSISNAAMVTTDDLPRQDDVHLTPEAAEVVGRRMADVYRQLKPL